MNKSFNTPELFLHKGQGQNKRFKRQLKTIFQYLQKHIATASMVSAATGIPQKNICRYKRDLEKSGRLWEIEKKLCKYTAFKAWYLITDPELLRTVADPSKVK